MTSSPAIASPAASGLNPERIRAALTDLLYRQAPAIFAGNLFVASLFVYILFDDAPVMHLAGWGGAIFALTGIRVAVTLVRPRHPALLSETHWAYLFAALSTISGFLWGSLSPLFLSPENAKAVLLIGVVLSGMVGGSVASLSSYLPAYWGFAIPAVTPFILRCFHIGGPLFNVFALLAIFLLGVNLYYSRVIYRALFESVRLRFENLLLVEQLAAERDRATAANRAKTQFLAAASHDLRQPTHAVSLFAATLATLSQQSPAVASDLVGNLSGKIEQALKGLRGLLDTLLDISRLDAGIVEAHPQATNLADVITRVRDDYAEAARSRGLDLRLHPRHAWGDTDPVLLQQIISNLVDNALKYTRTGGVLIGIRRHADAWYIDVVDTGIGITADQQSQVFEEFQQLHNPERDREKGFGLGLAIVRRLAGLLHHAISLRSRPGRGSTFRVEVRICRPRRAPSPPVPVAHPPQEAARARVLLIDDDQAIREAAESLLSLWGHQVVAIGDPADFQPDQEMAVDLIVSDYRLRAGLTGTQAIRHICAILGASPPAILITGDTSPERTREAAEGGFPLLHKPLDAASLHRAVTQALGSHVSARAPGTAADDAPGPP